MAEFYSLPRELRDHVYKFYFEVDDGYIYNSSTRKLTTASGQPIELALRFVSRLIRDETHGLALELNTLHFSSDYDYSLQERAGHFNALLGIVAERKVFYLLWKAAPSGCLDDTIYAHVEAWYPQYTALIRKLKPRHIFPSQCTSMLKETPSTSRQFVASTLNAIAAHPRFPKSTENAPLWAPRGPESDDPRKVIAYDCRPWKIPTEEDIMTMRDILGPERTVDDSASMGCRYYPRLKYRFSAASVAISFLDSLSLDSQLQIRKVVLHEEKEAVAWPECHAQGLIPFCQRNQKLRIERRVDLWKTILPAASCHLVEYDDRMPPFFPPPRCDRVQADSVASGTYRYGCIDSWIMEAVSLRSHGMPPQSFRLVIDGDLTPTQSTCVFDVVKRHAAWQTAFETCITDRTTWPTPPEWHKIRANRAYVMSGFPEALRAMTKGQSLVSCNFDIGQMSDTESLISQGRTWTLDEWEKNWKASMPANIDTDVPSCSWLDIQHESLLPPELSHPVVPSRRRPQLIFTS